MKKSSWHRKFKCLRTINTKNPVSEQFALEAHGIGLIERISLHVVVEFRFESMTLPTYTQENVGAPQIPEVNNAHTQNTGVTGTDAVLCARACMCVKHRWWLINCFKRTILKSLRFSEQIRTHTNGTWNTLIFPPQVFWLLRDHKIFHKNVPHRSMSVEIVSTVTCFPPFHEKFSATYSRFDERTTFSTVVRTIIGGRPGRLFAKAPTSMPYFSAFSRRKS